MVSASFSLTAGQDTKIGNVAVAANAPGAGDVEIRINLANVKTRKEAYKLIDAIRRFILAGALNTVFKP